MAGVGLVRRAGFRVVRVGPAAVLEVSGLAAVRGEIVPADLQEVRRLRDENRADRKVLIPPVRRGPVGRKTTPRLARGIGVDVTVALVEKDAAARGAGVALAADLEVLVADLEAPVADLVAQEWEPEWSWIRWSACRTPASLCGVGCWLCPNCAGGIWPM